MPPTLIAPKRMVRVQCYDAEKKTWDPGFKATNEQALSLLAGFLTMRGGGIGRVLEDNDQRAIIAYLQIEELPPF